jgi:hypothetical protein
LLIVFAETLVGAQHKLAAWTNAFFVIMDVKFGDLRPSLRLAALEEAISFGHHRSIVNSITSRTWRPSERDLVDVACVAVLRRKNRSTRTITSGEVSLLNAVQDKGGDLKPASQMAEQLWKNKKLHESVFKFLRVLSRYGRDFRPFLTSYP